MADTLKPAHLPLPPAITLHAAIFFATQATGLALCLMICFVLHDFTVQFVRMALVNSLFLGAGLVASCHLTRQLMFAVKTGFITLVTSLLVVGTGIVSLVVVLYSQPALFVYYFRGAIAFVVINFLFVITLHIISSGFIIYREIMAENERTIGNERLLKNRMELLLLTSRINPHFLFNTLNTILSLLRQPEKAENALLDLSDLLRQSLEQSDKQHIPVSQELNTVGKYLALQKLRFGDRLTFEIVGDAVFQIPPMIIQPLVENCIKHNMQNVPCLNIEIRIRTENGRNLIAVVDSAKALRPEMIGRGQGLSITQKRIENSNGSFEIINGGVVLSFRA